MCSLGTEGIAMGRSKKTDLIEDLEPELEEAMEAEGLEAADDSETSEDESEEIEASEDTDDEEEVVVKKRQARKPRAPRKPRAKKAEPSLLAAMSESVEEKAEEATPAPEMAVVVAAEAETETETEKPARQRAKRVTKEEQEEADVVGKPWVAVKEISGSISSNLERVNQMLREIPQQELFRPPVAKPAAITKVAVGMSFFAIVLSLVSLLLSQSARQVALERVNAPTQSYAHTVTAPTEAPKQLAFESSLPKRRPQRAQKKTTR